jgi:hypothetical protein
MTTEEKSISPKMQEFLDLVDRTVAKAQESDHAAVRSLIDKNADPAFKEVTPVMASLIFKSHNGHNRDLALSKATYYAEAMSRGEWKRHHQGIAFYADGNLADGQHRLAAVIFCGKPQIFLITTSFDDDAFDTIDIGKSRTAPDALALRGIADPGIKAAIARTTMQYEHLFQKNRSFTPTVIEIEQFIRANTEQFDTVIEMARTMVKNCSDPCLSESETATAALLLIRGGYQQGAVSGYLSAILLGVADREGAVTIDLGKQFLRAKVSEKRVHKMNKTVKMALVCKGASLYVDNKIVRSISWNPKKEPVPAPMPPLPMAAE